MELIRQAQAETTAWPPFAPPGKVYEQSHDGNRWRIEIVSWDRVGLEFRDFSLWSNSLANRDLEGLKRVGNDLAARLTYLMEPIRPIEIDGDALVVQMRSLPPSRDDQGTSYYELLARRGGELNLKRYLKIAAAERQVVPAPITRQVLWRLLEDFCQAAR